MALDVVIGIGIFVYLLWIFYEKLDSEHIILKLIIVFFSINISLLIPLHLTGLNISVILLKFSYNFYYLFIAYIISALVLGTLYKANIVKIKGVKR